MKREFVDLAAAKTGLTKKDTELVMDALFQTLAEILVNGDRLTVNGFGTFETKERGARMARNPRTGEAMPVPASRTAALKPAQALKDRLNQK